MRIDLSSTKGKRTLAGTPDEVADKAVAFLVEYQPAYGIDLTADDGTHEVNLTTPASVRASVRRFAAAAGEG